MKHTAFACRPHSAVWHTSPPLTFIVLATSVLTGFLRTRAQTHLLAGAPRAVAEGVRRKPFGRRRRCGFYPGDTQGALVVFF